jgi:hypothetical protein
MSRWVCKLCPTHGIGGPKGWEIHARMHHTGSVRLHTSSGFGFTGEYATGKYQQHKRWNRPAVAELGGEDDRPMLAVPVHGRSIMA